MFGALIFLTLLPGASDAGGPPVVTGSSEWLIRARRRCRRR